MDGTGRGRGDGGTEFKSGAIVCLEPFKIQREEQATRPRRTTEFDLSVSLSIQSSLRSGLPRGCRGIVDWGEAL